MSTLLLLAVAPLLWFSPTVFSLDIIRGPYLQLGTPTSITIRWRTEMQTESRMRYGVSREVMKIFERDAVITRDHEARLTKLEPNTKYYYSVGEEDGEFITAPEKEWVKTIRVWVIGDSGTGDANAEKARDNYYVITDSIHTDVWLMLGDNAYKNGTDKEFQVAVFEMYKKLLKKTVL